MMELKNSKTAHLAVLLSILIALYGFLVGCGSTDMGESARNSNNTDPIYQTIPIDFTVVLGVQDVKLYVDPECLVLIVPPIHFGEVARGGTVDFTMYAKNVGVETITLETRLFGDTGRGIIEIIPALPVILVSSAIQDYTLYITPSMDTPVGTIVNMTLEVFSQ